MAGWLNNLFKSGILLFLWPLWAGAEVYKCSDESGRVRYGDQPCHSGSRPLDMRNTLVNVIELDYAQRQAVQRSRQDQQRFQQQMQQMQQQRKQQDTIRARRYKEAQLRIQKQCQQLRQEEAFWKKKGRTKKQQQALERLEKKLLQCIGI